MTDVMVRGGDFYAVWDPRKGLWSTEEYDLQELVDAELTKLYQEQQSKLSGDVNLSLMSSYNSQSWTIYRRWIKNLPDSFTQLDRKLVFADDEPRREDYASKRLPYSLKSGPTDSWDKLVSTLYDEDNRRKIEWAVGSIFEGDSKWIQKFFVFYGEGGSGKSTIINIIERLFEGYSASFKSQALASGNNRFALAPLASNPLVALEHDGNLSRIADNTVLNSLIAHEKMPIDEKFKSAYEMKFDCMVFMGTNSPIHITDTKSGLIRRLIDICPSGNRVPHGEYDQLVRDIYAHLGELATHCIEVYKHYGPHYYDAYKPLSMMYKTNFLYAFVEDNLDEFDGGISLRSAYARYQEYCEESNINRMPKNKFKDEFKAFFHIFKQQTRTDSGSKVNNFYQSIKLDLFNIIELHAEPKKEYRLELDKSVSLLDDVLASCPAQLARDGIPASKWDSVDTVLSDIDTKEEHYVRPPINHIVIDFDLKVDGEKSKERNLEAASKWPPTYAEYSKGGSGIHLHYIYEGDPTQLSAMYDDNIEVKVFSGKASLRRRLSLCNDLPVATISEGLPLKERKVIDVQVMKNEDTLRDLIVRNLKKEIHPATRPSVDFIKKVLDDAYEQGMDYDLRVMKPTVIRFAANSTNQSEYCLKLIEQMHFCGKKNEEEFREIVQEKRKDPDGDIVFWDVEVFPNLFLVNWKVRGSKKVARMINPTAKDLEPLLKFKLVGFNCRRYDNHIMYGRMLGYNNYELFQLSQRIINGEKDAMFAEAYNMSYADIYDFASKKQSLKKWEIELGLVHKELDYPWDEPVPEDKWIKVAEYCDNDVIATEAVFDARHEDWVAREILAKISGLPINASTNAHTTKIVFGNNRHPQSQFVYTDLRKEFPGYEYKQKVNDEGRILGMESTYKGFVTGEGGFIHAKPGIYYNVALLDVTSMHPSSIENLNLFGDEYTKRYSEIKQARVVIKRGNREKARTLLNGVLSQFLDEGMDNKALADSLKIVINSVYGLTAAKFPNAFRDPRNVDNIVAKRGALFMVDLLEYVENEGFTVAHIKTDSIKIPEATPEIIQKVIDFGKKYGYEFEHEATYERMCLVNDAVYIAKYKDGDWTATGAQFQHPVVFKQLFSHEELTFRDYCEAKSVTSKMYIQRDDPDHSHFSFIGRVGLFVPVKDEPGIPGGALKRYNEKTQTYADVTGTKGYKWEDATLIEKANKPEWIDKTYARSLVDMAVATINKFGDFEEFVKAA
jgi:poxvirus D5 protein-like